MAPLSALPERTSDDVLAQPPATPNHRPRGSTVGGSSRVGVGEQKASRVSWRRSPLEHGANPHLDQWAAKRTWRTVSAVECRGGQPSAASGETLPQGPAVTSSFVGASAVRSSCRRSGSTQYQTQ